MQPSQVKADRIWLYNTFAYYLSFIALGGAAAVLGPTITDLADNTKSSLGEVSFIFAVHSVGYLIGSQLSGRFFDRIPGHPFMLGLLALTGVMLMIVPFVEVRWFFIPIFLLLGIGASGIDVGGNTLLVWSATKNPDAYMNGLHFFFGLGAAVAPIIIAQVVAMSSVQTAYWVIATMMLPAMLWLIFLRLPSPAIQKKEETTTTAPQNIDYWLVGGIVIFFFMYVGMEVSMAGWVSAYTTEMKLASDQTGDYLASAFWGALTVGRLIGVPISMRFAPNLILFVDLAVCVLGIAMILIFPGLTALWIGTIILGLGNASVFPTMMTFAQRRMTLTGKITAYFFIGTSTGSMAIPWLIGVLFEPVGPQIMLWMMLGATFAATAILIALILRYPYQEVVRTSVIVPRPEAVLEQA